MKIKDIFRVTRGSVLAADKVLLSKIDGYEYPVYSSQTKADGLLGYYNTYLYENAITWTTDGANAGTVHYRAGKFYCTNVCGVLLNKDGYANRCTAAILGSISKKYVSYVGNPKLMNNIMSEIPIIIPALEEQHKIDSFIAVLDKRIKAQQMMITSLKKYKRGVTAKLIAAIEGKYPVVKLGDHVTVMRGGSPRPIDVYITNAENGIRWIKIGDALPDQLYISDTKEKIKPEGAKKSRRVYAGDLILSNSMSFGRPYILKVDGCIHDGWLLIRDEEKKFDKRFLCFYLASDVTLAQYKKYAAGSCVNNLNSELVASVKIGMPPIEQQIRMANILEKIDRQVEAASTMYLLLSKLRSSLLQQLFI